MRHGLGGIGRGHGGKLALRLGWRVPLIGCNTTAGPNLQDIAEEDHHDHDAKSDGCADDAASLDSFVLLWVLVEAVVVGIARIVLFSLVALGAAFSIGVDALLHQARSEGVISPGALAQSEHVPSPSMLSPSCRAVPCAARHQARCPGSRRTARLMPQHAWGREHACSPFPLAPLQRHASRFAMRWGTHVLDVISRVCASLGQHGHGNNSEEERPAEHGVWVCFATGALRAQVAQIYADKLTT